MGGETMKVHVNENCIGCGLCEGICPSIFRINENSVAEAIAYEMDAKEVESVQEAMESCPVGAIEEV